MESKIKYGLIHCHSENSLKDSALTVTQLVQRAKQFGAPAVTLTDHGTMTGIFELLRAAEKQYNKKGEQTEDEIKAIPGVEAYVQEDDSLTRRSHLLLLAKNYDGYKAISRAVTKSNTRIKDVPRMNLAIIEEFFGENGKGHGNVIATSACVGGVLSTILLMNNELNRQIAKIQEKAKSYSSPEDPVYIGNLKLLDEYGIQVQELMEQRDALKKTADRKFGMRERALSKMSGKEYEDAKKSIDADKAETEQAKVDLAKLKTKLAAIKKRETVTRQTCRDAEKSQSKWKECEAEINRLKAGLRDDATLYEETKKMAAKYQSIFGSDFYIEVQNHGIPDEVIVMPKLAQIAKELGIHLVAANDVHFANNTEECVRARALVQAMRFNKWLTPRPDDTEYYIKTDEELMDWLGRILDTEAVDNAMHGIGEIVGKCNVVFPKETHFPRFVGGVEGETGAQRLRRLTEEGILKRYPNQEFKYRERVEYELSVIEKMQYTDYLCIVQDYFDYGRKLGLQCEEGVGYAIGPGRGSAAGSLVCYLIGITSVDPMPHGLIFERFLNPDRVSSPDIDGDLSMEVRGKVLEHVKKQYGEEAVCCIMTKGTLAAKNAVKSVARVRGSEKYDDTRKFMDLGNALAKIIPNEPKVKIADYEDKMRAAFPDNEDAQQIISDAKLVEGVAITYGMHAAGVIIADNGDVGDYIPLMWNEKNEQWCTQCDMIEAEKQAGLLKFDFLGLRNLDIITYTLRLIKRNTGVSIDIEQIPQEPQIYKQIFAKGKTNFVFQFESDGMKNLLKKFEPENLEHLILLNALFRPGPLQNADAICQVKAGKLKPTYVCEAAKDILELTYGYPVYQEQIMQLCHKVAGFTLGQADTIRRYMSKKIADKMAEYGPKFVEGLIASGAKPDDARKFWDSLMDFSSYAFNKSHAAVYATIAYYTAWLKFHYPTEYMTAVMNYTPADKLPMMVDECEQLGVKVLPPNVNESSAEFTGKNKSILFSLGNIKGIASGADAILADRAANGEYHSFKDFLTRVRPRKDVCEALIAAGALDMWCSNRAAMLSVFPDILSDIAKVADKKAIIESETDEKKIQNAEKKMLEYQDRIDQTVLPIGLPENKREKLSKENELLGMYISGHPLDEYPAAKELSTTTVANANEDGSYVTLCGFVRDLRITSRKADGAKMGFFKLDDGSGTIEVCCFAKAYQQYGLLLENGAVLAIEGKLNIEDEEDEQKKQLFAETVRAVMPKQHKLLVTVNGLPKWAETVYPLLIPYSSEFGMQVVVFDSALGEFRQTTLRLSADVLNDEFEDAEISEVDI